MCIRDSLISLLYVLPFQSRADAIIRFVGTISSFTCRNANRPVFEFRAMRIAFDHSVGGVDDRLCSMVKVAVRKTKV